MLLRQRRALDDGSRNRYARHSYGGAQRGRAFEAMGDGRFRSTLTKVPEYDDYKPQRKRKEPISVRCSGGARDNRSAKRESWVWIEGKRDYRWHSLMGHGSDGSRRMFVSLCSLVLGSCLTRLTQSRHPCKPLVVTAVGMAQAPRPTGLSATPSALHQQIPAVLRAVLPTPLPSRTLRTA